MAALAYALGLSTEVVGVEDDPGGGLRVYVGARWRRLYFVPDPADEGRIIREWAAAFNGHLMVRKDEAFGLFPHATFPGHEAGWHERGALR